MRHRVSCDHCRSQHKRCTMRSGATKCAECNEIGIECRRQPRIQFKHKHFGASGRPRNRRNTSTASDARRRPTARQRASTEPLETGIEHVFVIQPLGSPGHRRLTPPPPGTSISEGNEAIQVTGRRSTALLFPADITIRPETQEQQPEPDVINSTPGFLGVDDGNVAHGTPIANFSPTDVPSCVGGSGTTWFPCQLTEREAMLMRIFLKDITISLDSCDDRNHFATAVPKMAFEVPMVFFAVFALASRYEQLRTRDVDNLESTYYHNRCLELLIDALSHPPETYGVPLLTAVVLARLYEEWKVDSDTYFYHLDGTRNLLGYNAITRSAPDGGMAEAACWVHLRQAIYISIVHQRPLTIDLDLYSSFKSLQPLCNSDSSITKRSVYLLARLVKEMFAEPIQEGMEKDSRVLDELERALDEWHDTIPRSFCPIREDARDPEAGRPFPVIWVLSSMQVVALEYYTASRIMLCLQSIHSGYRRHGFEATRIRRVKEKAIREYLHKLIGLACGNEYYPGAFYMPSYMLALCGYLIKTPEERTYVIEFLNEMQEHRVYRGTRHIVQSLLRQWNELDGLGEDDINVGT